MYARSITVTGPYENTDAGIAHVRDILMPAVRELPDSLGISLLRDRRPGRCIITTAWTDEAAMQRSERLTEALRSDTAAAFNGDTELADWEIALMRRRHDAHHGACARVTWSQTEPDRIDDGIDTLRTAVLQMMVERLGFCSTSLLVDRRTGRSVLTVAYDSPQDMEATTEAAGALRAEIMPTIGTEVLKVAEFDIVLAHLRVPETE